MCHHYPAQSNQNFKMIFVLATNLSSSQVQAWQAWEKDAPVKVCLITFIWMPLIQKDPHALLRGAEAVTAEMLSPSFVNLLWRSWLGILNSVCVSRGGSEGAGRRLPRSGERRLSLLDD